MNDFYNTNNTIDTQESKAKRDTRNARIKRIFNNINGPASPERICDLYLLFFNERLNLLSCRRQITNLTKAGFLEKLGKEQMVQGNEGVKVHQWRRCLTA